MRERLRCRLLGGFGVEVGGRTIRETDWPLRRSKSIVKLLALTPGRALHREELIDLLWPDADPAAADHGFRQALYLARRTLGRHGRVLEFAGDMVALTPGAVATDVEEFEAAAAEARRSREVGAYDRAIALYADDLLPEDRYEDWTAVRREELRGTHLALLEERAVLLEASGGPGLAIEAFREVLHRDVANEGAHAALMGLYALGGRRQQALRQYVQLREALGRELNVEPSAAVQRLDEDIRAGRFPAPRATPIEAGPHARRHNLPSPITSFIGRESELSAVRGLLCQARLVSLVGSAGCGKTRLALEVAGGLVRDYPDGVWLCDLEALSDAERLPEAVAAPLGVREHPGQPLSATLVDHLRARRLLIVLDNCERLVEPCASLVGALLRDAPGVRVLTTGRQALGMTGEVVYRLEGLAVPVGEQEGPAAIAPYEAIRLFVERARDLRPEFALTARNAAAVAQICVRLGGMPLAIELAAARVNALSPEHVASRLDERFRLLTAASPTAAPRQRSLRAAIDWSYDHLSSAERELFRRLSVFAGGWTLEAAEAVGASGDAPLGAVLDLLSHLVDKSLVSVEPARDGTVRYRLLETLREYARDRLEGKAERDDLARRHATYFAELAEEAERHSAAADQRAWLDRLDAEAENLQLALRWSIDTRDAVLALRLASARGWHWRARSRFREGRALLEAALALPAITPARDGLRAKALMEAGASAVILDDYARARSLLEEGVGICRRVGDRGRLARSLVWLGSVFETQGEYATARACDEEALAIHRGLGDRAEVSRVLSLLSRLALDLGEYESADTLSREALAIQRECGYEWGAAVSVYRLGQTAFRRGERAAARALLEESLAFLREFHDAQLTAYALMWLGRIAAAEGDHAGARARQLESLSLLLEQGDRNGVSRAFDALAELAAAEGVP